MKATKRGLFIIIIGAFFYFGFSNKQKDNKVCTVNPLPYENAIKNPLMGFTTNGIHDHPWATTAQTYIFWNDIENRESDNIEKIKNYCDSLWSGIEAKNIKVIPRVILHWNGDKKFWPADMQKDDYTSEQFQKRVVRLIERLGECWDNDPRVAFVEMGIFGKWGEHHSPFPTPEMQKLVGDTFMKAFKIKKVTVRRMWQHFTDYSFGEYWDSWAHYDQMFSQGTKIDSLNKTGRYKDSFIGGEVAYDWGNGSIQPGPSPTASVADEKHRKFMINSIKWLHCTQLRWIDNYDQKNPDAVKGAEEIQKVFGYRFVLDEVRFSLDNSLNVDFDVTNSGSAPFYYNWPVEVALLDPETKQPVWTSTFDTDIRQWHPGEGWTDPTWIKTSNRAVKNVDSTWNATGICKWAKLPVKNIVKGNFMVNIPERKAYILSLAILDPAGNFPSVRFANTNYLNGGRFPIGVVDFAKKQCSPLPSDFKFDDLYMDKSIHYQYVSN